MNAERTSTAGAIEPPRGWPSLIGWSGSLAPCPAGGSHGGMPHLRWRPPTHTASGQRKSPWTSCSAGDRLRRRSCRSQAGGPFRRPPSML